jgi:DNA-binding transcriptional MerR regulator
MYRTKTVAELLGIPRNTLLAWERRYELVQPDRQDNGYRTYTEDDLRRLRALKRLLDDGHRIGEAVAMVSAQPAAEPRQRGGTAQLVEDLLSHLLSFDRDAAVRALEGAGPLRFSTQVDEVLGPVLRRLGEGWIAGTVSIAQEHFGSAFCRERLQGILTQLGSGPDEGPGAVLAGFPGDPHEGGLLMAAVHLSLRGHRVSVLGPDVPAEAIIEVARARHPRLVGVSVMRVATATEVIAHAQLLDAALPPSVWLLLSGPGLGDAELPLMRRVLWRADARALPEGPPPVDPDLAR